MRTARFDTPGWSPSRQQLEAELLIQLRRAEAEFHEASADQKEQAGERFRQALERFSRLILDRRFPLNR